jgi:predicted transcriptional regulator
VFIKHTFIGIVAAMTIPLILNLFSSDLLDAGQTKPLKLFALSGLCICFAFFSVRFLEQLYGNRLKRESKYPQEIHQKEVDQQKSDYKRDKVSTKEGNSGAAVPAISPEKAKMMEYQVKILRALACAEEAKMTPEILLNVTGIAKKEFDEPLSLLMAKGSVVQELTNGEELQFVLTARGRQQVNKITGS